MFVGSFKTTSKDGGVGGQMFASKTIVNSPISNSVNWTLIDTTADSNILASTFARAKKALLRVIKFLYHILFFKYHSVLIFVGDGLSFWEKGLMCVIAKFFSNSRVILAPRSGFILNDIKKQGALRNFIIYVFKKVDFIVCQSLYWKELFQELGNSNDSSKFVIIENMIDFEKYAKIPIKNIDEKESVIILFMAWVTKNKGIYELIEAINLLKEENLNFKLIVAGKGSDFDNIGEIISNNDLSNYVELKGWVLGEEKMDLLHQADVFVLPTYFEGYPNSLVEAMASGKACVATNVGAIPDMIKEYETGLLIEKESNQQLYSALKILIQNSALRRRLSENARSQVKSTNSIASGISKFEKLFK